MSKWQREDKIQERLEQENRELKKEVHRLHKLVKKLNRGYHKLVEEDLVEEEHIPAEIIKKCWDCNGEYKEIIIMNRRFRQCQQCGKRGKVTLL